MDATLTIQVRVIGQQAAAQLAALQKQVAATATAGSGAAAAATGGAGAFSGISGVAAGAMGVMGKLGGVIDSMEKKLGGLAQHTGMAGRQLTFGFTLPVVAAGTAMTGWALETEKAMTQVRKVYGDFSFTQERVKEETDALAHTFTLLSNAYGVNSAEVIEMGSKWAAVGLTGTTLARATKATLEAMVLGGLEQEQAVNTMLTLASAYKLSFADMGNGFSEVTDAMSILNAIENQTGASFADLAEGMTRSAGVAHEYGLTIQELGGLIATLVPATGSGAAAGNAIKSMLSRIMVPLEDTKEILTEIGIDMEGKEWVDASALQRIQIMADKFQYLDQNTKNAVSSMVAGRWQVNRFSQMMSDVSGQESFEKAMNASGDATRRQNTYMKEMNTVLASNPKRFEILTNMIKNELTEVMIGLLPIILKFIGYMERLTNWFNNLTPKTRGWVLSIIGVIAAMGPMLMMFAALIRVLQGVFLGLKFLNGIVVGTAKALGFLFSAIYTLVQGFITAIIWTGRLAIQLGTILAREAGKAIVQLNYLLSALWNTAAVMAKTFISAVARAAAAIWQFILRLVLNAAILTGTFLQGLAAAAAQMAGQFVAGVSLAVTSLGRMIVALVNVIWELGTMAVFMAGQWAGNIAMGAQVLMAQMIPALQRFWTELIYTTKWLAMLAYHLILEIGLIGEQFVAAAANGARALLGQMIPALASFVGSLQRAIVMGAAFLFQLGLDITAMAVDFVVACGRAAVALATQLVPSVVTAARSFMVLASSAIISGTAMLAALAGQVVPAVMGIMSTIAAAVVGIAAVVGLPVWAVVAIIVAALAVIAIVVAAVFNDGFHDTIVEALWSVYDNMVRFGQFLVDIFIWIYDQLVSVIQAIIDLFSYLNPFARHSPSLVDNVKAGVGVILDEYNKLKHVPNLVRAAAAAQKAFMNATKGARDTEENRKISVDREIVVSQAPQATGAFDSMIQARKVLEAALIPLTAEIDRQAQIVAKLQARWDDLDEELRGHQRTLDDLEKAYNKVGEAIEAAQSRINELLSTPLTGQTAMEDQIYANELAIKRLKLQLMDMEDAADGVGEVTDAFKDLQQAIDDLQGVRDTLYLGGAGSDILGVYDEQLAALRAQQKAIGGSINSIDALKAKIEELERVGERLDLQKALTFDDQERQLERMANTMAEMSFGDISSEILKQKEIIKSLQPIYDQLGAKVEAERATVERLTDERDRLGRILDDEKEKLSLLEQAFADISSLISDMNSDMQSFVQGLKDAKQAAEELANAGSGVVPGDYPIPSGSGLEDIPGIEDLPELNKQLEDLNKELGKLELLPNPFAKIGEWISDLPGDLWNDIQWIGGIGWDIVMGIWDGIVAAGEYVWDLITGWIGDYIIGPITRGLGIHSPSTVMRDQVGWPLVMGIWEGMKAAAGWLGERLLEVPGWIIGALAGAGTWLVGTGWSIIVGLWNGMLSVSGWLIEQVSTIIWWVWAGVKGAAKWLYDTGRLIIEGVWNGMKSLSGWLTSQMGNIFWWVAGGVTTAGTWLWNTGRSVITGLWNGMVSVYGWFVGAVSTIASWVWNGVTGAATWLSTTGMNVIIGFWNGMVAKAQWLKDSVLGLVKWAIPDVVERFFQMDSPSKLMAGLGAYITQGLAQGIVSETDTVINAASVLAEGVKSAMQIEAPDFSANVDFAANVTGLPTVEDLNALQSSVFSMTGGLVGASATEAVRNVTNQYNNTSPMWAVTKEKEIGYQGTAAMGAPQAPVIVQTPEASKTVTLSGDLVFPNITSGDDAQLLIDNLKSMVDD